jgi:hypothetical protein
MLGLSHIHAALGALTHTHNALAGGHVQLSVILDVIKTPRARDDPLVNFFWSTQGQQETHRSKFSSSAGMYMYMYL